MKIHFYLLIVILLTTILSSQYSFVCFSWFSYIDILAEAWFRVRNKGGYVARFFVDYHALHTSAESFISRLYIPIRLFEQTIPSGNYPVGRTRVIDVPFNAVTARIRVERFIFYPFFGWHWKEIFRQEMNPQDKRCFDIWGTTDHPRWTSVNC